MKLSFSTKIVVVSFLIAVCSTQTNARRLYKWVDNTSVTNYSEFKPKEGTSRKLEVLESRGDDHVDPAMAVTAQMKPIEIPLDQTNTQVQPANTIAQPAPQPATQTVVKQGAIAAPYTRPITTAASNIPTTEKKEVQPTQQVQVMEKKDVANPFVEKAASAVATIEKKEEVIVVAQPEKKVQPKINPWTRKVEFVPSNLVPQNLPKTSTSADKN